MGGGIARQTCPAMPCYCATGYVGLGLGLAPSRLTQPSVKVGDQTPSRPEGASSAFPEICGTNLSAGQGRPTATACRRTRRRQGQAYGAATFPSLAQTPRVLDRVCVRRPTHTAVGTKISLRRGRTKITCKGYPSGKRDIEKGRRWPAFFIISLRHAQTISSAKLGHPRSYVDR